MLESYWYDFLMAILYPHKSFIFNMRKIFHQKCKDFLYLLSSCNDGFMNFLFFFYDGSYHETNVGSCSCRPQSMAHIKQSKFSCHVMTFLCSFRKLAALLVGLGYRLHDAIQDLHFTLRKHVRTRERSLFTVTYNLLKRKLVTWRWLHHMAL